MRATSCTESFENFYSHPDILPGLLFLFLFFSAPPRKWKSRSVNFAGWFFFSFLFLPLNYSNLG